MSNSDPIVIVGASRTPMGGFQGDFASAQATDLGAAAIRGALAGAGLAPEAVEDVFMGCVLPAGQGQAPARQASIKAGIPVSTGATTINKMCGSGMKATMLAHDLLLAGSANVIVSGGMESMTNAPICCPRHVAGIVWDTARFSTTCSLTGLKTHMTKAVSWAPLPKIARKPINSPVKLRMNSPLPH